MRFAAFIGTLLITLNVASASQAIPDLSLVGKAAMKTTVTLLDFGPRPPGSTALQNAQKYVINRLQAKKLTIKADPFTVATPVGKRQMRNVIGMQAGSSNRFVMLACHLDSKLMKEIRFVGANDSASACALILELVPYLQTTLKKLGVWYVFFDGEEAFKEWSATDSLYGSRQLAAEMAKSGLAGNARALILLDMIGDKDLDVALETNSSPELVLLAQSSLRQPGLFNPEWQKRFFNYRVGLADDHIPFLQAGIPALDLIDFNYGPKVAGQVYEGAGPFHHTSEDTIDKLSHESLKIVGMLVVQMLNQLEQQEN